MRRRVNKGYYNKGYVRQYDKQAKTLSDNLFKFRYANVQKGDFIGNQLIAGWLSTGTSKVLRTDSQYLKDNINELRGWKFYDSKTIEELLVTQINPDLEFGAYDPIFGLPLTGNPEDVRSVGFIEVVSGATYLFNLVGVEAEQSTYTFKGTFGSVDSTTGGDLPQFNVGNVTNKGTFGSASSTTGGDLPSSGAVFGDKYTCNKDDFNSTVAGLTFDNGDVAIYNGSTWEKNPIVAEVNDGYSCDTNGYVSVIGGRTYNTNEVAVLNSSFAWIFTPDSKLINVLQFDDNDQTTASVDQIAYNEKLTLEDDTTKVKIWAAGTLLDSSNVNIITTYRISQYDTQFQGKSEIEQVTLATDDEQMIGAIRQRKNRDVLVIKVS